MAADYIIDTAGGEDYPSMAAWSIADRTLSAPELVECRASGAGAADTAAVIIEGWTTTAANYIKLYTETGYRHDGGTYPASGNIYRLQVAAGWTFNRAIYVVNADIRFIGLAVRVTSAGYNSTHAIQVFSNSATAWEIYIEQCIFKGVYSGSAAGPNYAIYYNNWPSAAPIFRISNNVIYDFVNSTNDNGAIYGEGTGTIYSYNNTAFNCYKGFSRASNVTFTCYNCIANDCNDGFVGTIGGDYNCSDIASDAPGANSRNGTNGDVTFEGAEDFHLSSSDTNARGNGTDLSADGNYPISVDIDDETRSAWDIGADEFSGAAAQSATLGMASATAAGYSVSVTLGQLASTLEMANAAAAGYSVTALNPGPSQATTLQMASATASGLPVTIDTSTSVTLEMANATAAANSATVALGALSSTLEVANADAAGYAVTVDQGAAAQSITLEMANATAAALPVTINLGTLETTLQMASATADVLPVSITLGQIEATLQIANATATGLPVSVIVFGETQTLTLEMANAIAAGLPVQVETGALVDPIFLVAL